MDDRFHYYCTINSNSVMILLVKKQISLILIESPNEISKGQGLESNGILQTC